MRRPDGSTSDTEPGSPLTDEEVQLPGGWGDGEEPLPAGDEEPEEEPEATQDAAGEDDEEDGDKPLTPAEVRALRQELTAAQSVIGRQGEELGRLRRGESDAVHPVQGTQQQEDPYETALAQATDDFVNRHQDPRKYAAEMAKINRQMIAAAGQFFQQQIVGESRAETDFFAKNSDLQEGTPRSIFEGELAKAKLQNPRGTVSEQRTEAAKSTRTLLKDLHWRLVDEDDAARREGSRLTGPRGRQSRTGSQSTGRTANQAMAENTAAYRRELAEMRERTSSGRRVSQNGSRT